MMTTDRKDNKGEAYKKETPELLCCVNGLLARGHAMCGDVIAAKYCSLPYGECELQTLAKK